MKTSSTDLHDLIHAMSSAEKSFFRKSSHTGDPESHLYMKLYQAIEKQEVYDEEALKELFRDEKLVRQFSVAKNHLYRLIKRRLRAFHIEGRSEIRINELLTDARILREKKLYMQAAKALDAARRIAEKFGMDYYLMTILHRQALLAQEAAGDLRGRIGSSTPRLLYDQLADKLTEITEEVKYRQQAATIFYQQALEQTGRAPSTSPRVDAETLRRLTENPEAAPTDMARLLAYRIRQNQHLSARRYAEALVDLMAERRLLEANPERLAEDPMPYVTLTENLLICLYGTRQYGLIADQLARLKELETQTPEDQARVFARYLQWQTRFYLRTGQFDLARQLVMGLGRQFEASRHLLTRELRLQILLVFAQTFLLAGEALEGWQYLERIDGIARKRRKQETTIYPVVFSGELMRILYYFETHNVELDHLLRSLDSNLRARPIRPIIQIMRQYLLVGNTVGQFAVLQPSQLSSLIEELRYFSTQNPETWALWRHFPVVEWLESKRDGSSLADRLRESMA
jgi:hypothetical protein